MAAKSKIKILFLDDHQMLIDGLKALLKHETRFEIVGEATRAERAIELIPEVRPDVVVTDINMPGISGIEFTKSVHELYPDIKILALSMYGEKGMISEMLDAGVSGYILKNTGKEELVNALQKIYDGGLFFSEDVSAEMMRSIHEKKRISYEVKKAHLTPREKEIIELIAREFSNAKIAETLFISERTVESHRKNIFRKTDTKSLVGLIKYAIENKLTE